MSSLDKRKELNKAVTRKHHKYLLIYRFVKSGKYVWTGFNYLDELRRETNFIIKNAENFRILYKRNMFDFLAKYKTLISKDGLKVLVANEIEKRIKEDGGIRLLHNNIRTFKEKMEKL